VKDTARLLLYFAGTLLVGALFAPVLFWTAQSPSAHRMLPMLSRFDFETYFHRALLISALMLLWPLLRALQVRGWRDLGLEKNQRKTQDVLAGFLIAAIPLLCCGAALILLQIYSLRPAILWGKLGTVVFASAFVPLIEELLFRGLILGVLLRSNSRFAAMVLTSALFAVLHFLKAPDQTTPAGDVNWASGFVSIANSFWQFRDPMLLAAGFTTLFVIAWILADARLKTRSLWLPIGLHAGWIFANGAFSRAAHREHLALPWIGKNLMVGIAPLIVAVASWALMNGWLNYVRSRQT
jgi:membrane protease YdiL (CAAX protease family)